MLWQPENTEQKNLFCLLPLQLDWPFEDGDRWHPPANIKKMSQGTPLTDEVYGNDHGLTVI